MGRKNKNKSKLEKDRHHIVPKSKGGTSEIWNTKIVNKYLHHEHYHKLFGNKTPDEIIQYLVYYWWNGQWHWVSKALKDNETK